MTSTEIGKMLTYSLLAFNIFVMWAFVYRYVPETKDKSIAECVLLIQNSRGKRTIKNQESA